MNILPNDNDNGYGAAEMAQGEMSCNDGYALHEMMQPVSAVPTNAPETFTVHTINSNPQANP